MSVGLRYANPTYGTANWMHSYSKEWFGSASASFKRLAGSAQYSPLVLRRTSNSFNFLLGYRF